MKFIRSLPFMLAGLHAAFTVIVFVLANKRPGGLELLPLIVFTLDYPISLLLVRVSNLFDPYLGFKGRELVDCSAFLIGGSAWFYLIGWLARAAVLRLLMREGSVK
jgi:hypothetical protein